MRTCPSCGGVIGRDCFNPDECAYITQAMEVEQQVNSKTHDMRREMEAAQYAYQLECNVTAKLTAALEKIIELHETAQAEAEHNHYEADPEVHGIYRCRKIAEAALGCRELPT